MDLLNIKIIQFVLVLVVLSSVLTLPLKNDLMENNNENIQTKGYQLTISAENDDEEGIVLTLEGVGEIYTSQDGNTKVEGMGKVQHSSGPFATDVVDYRLGLRVVFSS